MRSILAALCLTLAALSAGPVDRAGPARSRGCEPAEPIGLHARIVSIDQDGGAASVLVDVTVSSDIDLTTVALSGRLQHADGGFSRELGLPAGVVPRGYELTTRHVLRMESGRDYDLFLTLHGRPLAGPAATVTTWLPVPLDPARRPREAGRVLEFHAQTLSGGEP